MHAVKDGPANRSFGLQVAALAGLPRAVLGEARRTLAELEQRSRDMPATATSPAAIEQPAQMALFRSPPPALDALAAVLSTLRGYATGRLICVFGCGGDRDTGKRPVMGAIAAEKADIAIVTDDNPRSEPSRAILEQILAGMRDGDAVQVIADRAEAIHYALAEADAGDVVVIAGKGHEERQIVGAESRPFSDRQVVLDALGSEA
jgi:hypothetical protein